MLDFGGIPQPQFGSGVQSGVTHQQPQQQQQQQQWQALPPQQWIVQQADPNRPLFDEKMAVSDAMKFLESKDDQFKWAKVTSKYLVGRVPELDEMFKWAGRFQSVAIADVDIMSLRNSPWIRGRDPIKISNDLVQPQLEHGEWCRIVLGQAVCFAHLHDDDEVTMFSGLPGTGIMLRVWGWELR